MLGRGFNCSDCGSCRCSYTALLGGQTLATNMSLSGGAFLHSHAKAMTHEITSATVCEGRGQVAGCEPCVRMLVLQALVGIGT